jgi:hypothetical protein
MEGFYENFQRLDHAGRRDKLDQILAFVRAQNAPDIAVLFQDLRTCYPIFPLFQNERRFQEYLAWGALCRRSGHPLVKHVFSQG